jgi:hypothetical protein
MNWYSGVNGYMQPNVPCLAIGFENGKLQLMKHEKDKGNFFGGLTVSSTNYRYTNEASSDTLEPQWLSIGSIWGTVHQVLFRRRKRNLRCSNL